MKKYTMVEITADDGASETIHFADAKIGAKRALTKGGWLKRLVAYFGKCVYKYDIVYS